MPGELASESTVIEGQGYTVQHGYDVHGRRTLTTYPGGVEVSYGYDTASRVNTLQAKVGGTCRNVATGVTYDAAGRIFWGTKERGGFLETNSQFGPPG